MLTSKYACELCVPSLSPALCQRRSPLGLNALAARMLMQAVSLSFRLLLPVSVGRSGFRRQSKHLGPSCKSTLPKNVGRPQCNDQGELTVPYVVDCTIRQGVLTVPYVKTKAWFSPHRSEKEGLRFRVDLVYTVPRTMTTTHAA